MKQYIVEHTADDDAPRELFLCQADDEQHAYEQCGDAYPEHTMHSSTVASRSDLLLLRSSSGGMVVQPTLAEVEEALRRGAIEVLVGNGRWWKCRRNGMTKRWKRTPQRWRIPIKFGLRDCVYLEDNTSAGYYRFVQ